MILRLALYGVFVTLPVVGYAQSYDSPLGQRDQNEINLPPQGYLCCNMRSTGGWISDINYVERNQQLLSVGAAVRPVSYGRYRLNTEIGGRSQAIGNDYSRNLPMEVFAKRYVVTQNPALKLGTYPEKIRTAITSARVTPGMTREQVIMAIGYPVTDENPSLEAKTWRFWLSSFAEYQIVFDDHGKVKEIVADTHTRQQVVLD